VRSWDRAQGNAVDMEELKDQVLLQLFAGARMQHRRSPLLRKARQCAELGSTCGE